MPGARTKTKYIFLIVNHNIKLDHLVKVESARFLHWNVSSFPFPYSIVRNSLSF